MTFTVGCDPELFVHNNQHHISLIGKIGGTKGKPVPLPNGGGVQEDNLALEFNTEPATSQKEFIRKVVSAREDIRELIKPFKGVIADSSTVTFPKLELENDLAQEFGCDPDINAWNLEFNPIPQLKGSSYRCAGGHVHVGWDFKDDVERINMARLMDVFLGLPSLIENHAGASRRKWYGKAGAHRAKEYGIEYRVLSNYWIFNDKRIGNIFRRTKLAHQHLPQADEIINSLGAENIVTTINAGRMASAEQMIMDVENQFGVAL